MSSSLELRTIEFRNLYEEIKYHSDRVESIITLAISSTGAVYGVICSLIFVKESLIVGNDTMITAAAAKNIIPGLFLVPMFFILPSIVLVASHFNSIARVASYIQVFYEEQQSNEGIGWQKRIQQVRHMGKHEAEVKAGREVRFLGKAISYILDGLSSSCIVFSLLSILFVEFMSQCPIKTTISVGYVILTLILYVLNRFLVRACSETWGTERFDYYIQSWKNLRGAAVWPES